VVCACTAAAVQDNIEFGLLTCTLSEHTAVEPGAATQARDVMCTFKVRSGAQETYLGKVEVVNISATEKITLVWRVKVPQMTPAPPGFLAQSYAADRRTPANQMPDLVGQANSKITLESMADKEEGRASMKERSPTDGVGVLGIDLNLKSTTG